MNTVEQMFSSFRYPPNHGEVCKSPMNHHEWFCYLWRNVGSGGPTFISRSNLRFSRLIWKYEYESEKRIERRKCVATTWHEESEMRQSYPTPSPPLPSEWRGIAIPLCTANVYGWIYAFTQMHSGMMGCIIHEMPLLRLTSLSVFDAWSILSSYRS